MSPRSVHRKPAKSAKAKRRANGNNPVKVVKGNTVQISKNRIAQLRDDPDFSAAIKAGRALNALSFSGAVLNQWSKNKLPDERRNNFRSMFVIASYVHETLLLLKELDKVYGQDPSFQDAALLLVDKSKWAVSEKMRNRVGFHLDHGDEVTTKTLQSLPKKNADLYSAADLGPEMTIGNYYFDFADHIDSTYFIEQFKAPGRTTEKQVNEFMVKELSDLTVKLIRALKVFHFSLLGRLGLY